MSSVPMNASRESWRKAMECFEKTIQRALSEAEAVLSTNTFESANLIRENIDDLRAYLDEQGKI
jgi:hypothetical protein